MNFIMPENENHDGKNFLKNKKIEEDKKELSSYFNYSFYCVFQVSNCKQVVIANFKPINDILTESQLSNT